ncbi:MAG: hypothetical protein ACJ71W_16165 [Terriglobales bacterium]
MNNKPKRQSQPLRKESSTLRQCLSRLAVVSAWLMFLPMPLVFADAGVFTGNGQNLHQISSKEVRLVSIDVNIVLERGPFLFDGGVSGMDKAEYSCTFVLQNLSAKPVEIQVGFPVDSQFAREGASDSREDATEWVLDYGFIARDETATYNINFVRRKKRSPDEFAALFVWRMNFAPNENKTLSVRYHIPISMGLVSLAKDEKHFQSISESPALQFLDNGILEMAGYITSTGSSWSGTVKTATFTVITEPFEHYLDRRGVSEESEKKLRGFSDEDAAQPKNPFPVQHPWWFRKITPDGWTKVEGGVQWRYTDFKPKDPIDVRYYLTQFPHLLDEVNSFVDGLLASGSSGQDLERVRQIVLATYGKEPEDITAKEFAHAQLWYTPRNDFSIEHLTQGQKAVLMMLDARIAREKSGPGSSR